MEATLSAKTAASRAPAKEKRRLLTVLDKFTQVAGEFHKRQRTAQDANAQAAALIGLVRDMVADNALPTLEPLLPLLLSLKGHPYTLEDHFPFSPMFGRPLDVAKKTLLKSGRQVSKSTSQAGSSVVQAAAIPYFTNLVVTPLFEQVRRFSTNYVAPFIDESPVRSLWSGAGVSQNVLQRAFANKSKLIFSFALLDADRIRGISADRCTIDELQDMDVKHLPIILETLSHSKHAIQSYSGTPKTFDNAIEKKWSLCSQAEWFIPCTHCTTNGYPTINIPSADYHLVQMIGPVRDDISEERPGTICWKCRQPVNPRFGRWVHRREDVRLDFAGYHIPQIIMPLHYSDPKKWAELVGKAQGSGIAPYVVYNEVFGESYDLGSKLVSETDLKKAAMLPIRNEGRRPTRDVFDRLKSYVMTVLAVDWGGGGEDMTSFTTCALLGYTASGLIEVIWGCRLMTPNDHLREAKEIFEFFKMFKPDYLTHDYTGAGTLRETFLVQAGVPARIIIPIAYVRSASSNLIDFAPATIHHPRDHWRVDKARSLLNTVNCIKLCILRFFQYDWVSQDNPGLLYDFLALIQEKSESRTAGDIFRIGRSETAGPDDFAQAVNIGCVTIWHMQKSWPNFTIARSKPLTANQVRAAGNRDYGWESPAAGFLDRGR